MLVLHLAVNQNQDFIDAITNPRQVCMKPSHALRQLSSHISGQVRACLQMFLWLECLGLHAIACTLVDTSSLCRRAVCLVKDVSVNVERLDVESVGPGAGSYIVS